mgnify:CR=1 FL=1
MSKIDFRFGDFYDDGHGKHETITIETDTPRNEIYEAYKASCKSLNVDFKEICSQYEDSYINEDIFNILDDKLELDPILVKYMREEEFYVDGVDELFDLLMKFIEYSLDFKWEKIQSYNDVFQEQFGYGLFH